MTDRCRLTLRLALLAAACLALSCAKRERDEVFDGERVNEAGEPGLVAGHVHLFELVQWGAPGGGIVAAKRAERDALKVQVAQQEVDLLLAKVERGVLEERELKIIRVQYGQDNWERAKATVKRPPNGKVEPTTIMAPQQPGRPAHPVPGVIVEQYQEQMPKEVVRTPEEARAFWAKKLEEAQQALAAAQALAARQQAPPESPAAQPPPQVEKTRVRFAVLPLRPRDVMFDPPSHPKGYAVDPGIARARKALMLASLGELTPPPPAFSDRAALEKGVELTERIHVAGLDSDKLQPFDPKDGKLVLKLVGRCPARVFEVKEEVMVNPGYVISIPQSGGFARWFEVAYPKCAPSEQALRTQVTDLVAGDAAKEEPQIDADLSQLRFKRETTAYHLGRVRAMKAK